MHDDEDDEIGTVKAAAYLGRSPRTVTDWRYYGIGPAYRKDSNGRVTYRRADLDAWLAEHPHQAA